MSKNHRAGGKFTSSHTTLIPAAMIIANIAEESPLISKIAIGMITPGMKSVAGRKRVKIVKEESCLLLTIRDNTSLQELRVYSPDLQKAMEVIAREARNNNFQVSFII